MLSVVIPARNERLLLRTVEDLLIKSRGDVEIIVVLDGYDIERIRDPRVIYLHRERARGMRAAINEAVAASRGEFVMKIDAHCMVDDGYDVKLTADCPNETVVIPRRKRLDGDNWCILQTPKPDVDYEYLSCPTELNGTISGGLAGTQWNDRSRLRIGKSQFSIDENMSFQGSCWVMRRSYFDFLELMDEARYGTFFYEALEIGLKAWLSGGRVLTNKLTWYAHLHKKREHGRGYPLSKEERRIGSAFVIRWLSNEAGWKKQTRPFAWLIEHFTPVPSWPRDWKEHFPQCLTLPS